MPDRCVVVVNWHLPSKQLRVAPKVSPLVNNLRLCSHLNGARQKRGL